MNEMLLSAPGGGLYIKLFPFFPKNEPAAFTTLRSKGGWLVSAAQSALGVISDVRIEATVAGTNTVRLLSPWGGNRSTLPEHVHVVCSSSPTSPNVTLSAAGSRTGLLTWTMVGGQACTVQCIGACTPS